MSLPTRPTFRMPQRWVWLVVPVLVGVTAWVLLGQLRDREERAVLAAAKAGQVQDSLRTSIRTGAALWRETRSAAVRGALATALDVQTDALVSQTEALGELLPGDARVVRLRRAIERGRIARANAALGANLEDLLGVGAEITATTDAIRAEQQQRRDAARRQTLIGSAIVLLLALVSIVALAARAQRQLAAASARHAASLARLAAEDALTGLANRRGLDEDLDALGDGAAQVLLWDLDGFKAFNDTHGHAAGDALLVTFARTLERLAGRDGRAYRLGGDEFCVVSASGADLRERAMRLAAQPVDGGVTATVGWASWPAEAPDPEAALALADARMYDGKRVKRRPAVAVAR